MFSYHDGSYNGQWSGITPPASAPVTPTRLYSRSPTPFTTSSRSVQHGGAEQEQRDVLGRSAPFRSSNVPRTPRRARSPGDEEGRSRDRDRANGQRENQDLGLAARIVAIERTLGEHLCGIEAHRKFIDEIRPWKTNLEERLDSAFKSWNERISGLDKSHVLAREGLRDEMSSILQAASSRMDKIEQDFQSMMMRLERMGQPSQQPPMGPPPGMAPTAESGGFVTSTIPDTWSPLSGNQATTDPWEQFRQSGTSYSSGPVPTQDPWAQSRVASQQP